MSGLVARVTVPGEPADFSAVLAGAWTALTPAELVRRPVVVAGRGELPLGEVCELTGTPDGTVRFTGDLSRVIRLGAGLTEGALLVDGSVGDEVGLGMAGGSIEVRGDAGARAGGAAPEARRGMTGGELVVHGSAGESAGALMRRGLLAVGGRVDHHAGAGMIAGTVIAFGDVGAAAGLWSKRGSIVALAGVTIPSTYRYACTYRPPHVRLLLTHLRRRHKIDVDERFVDGLYRRFTGDVSTVGRGEILAWVAG